MLYDVGKMDAFYNGTLGQMVSKSLSNELSKLWSPTNTTSNIVVGFPLDFFPSDVICPVLMPTEIGRMPLEYENSVYSVLIDSKSWPLESDTVDYIFITHALEFIPDQQNFLLEAKRVLKSAGKLILMVPHRGGLWSKADATPFGHGTPFSKGQIFKILKNSGLSPEKCIRSLFLPPFADKLPKALSDQIEIIGEHLLQLLGGVLIVEATKMVYAEPRKNRATQKKSSFAPIKSHSAYSILNYFALKF